MSDIIPFNNLNYYSLKKSPNISEEYFKLLDTNPIICVFFSLYITIYNISIRIQKNIHFPPFISIFLLFTETVALYTNKIIFFESNVSNVKNFFHDLLTSTKIEKIYKKKDDEDVESYKYMLNKNLEQHFNENLINFLNFFNIKTVFTEKISIENLIPWPTKCSAHLWMLIHILNDSEEINNNEFFRERYIPILLNLDKFIMCSNCAHHYKENLKLIESSLFNGDEIDEIFIKLHSTISIEKFFEEHLNYKSEKINIIRHYFAYKEKIIQRNHLFLYFFKKIQNIIKKRNN
ncbi:hypothetical protein LbFV_ORF97 [Leptopilina boulardi filamentous virus]|uniref:Sulfhydryl oxidase n=1 Tax=Leptopilina boulardi filamentous virus TaxID=552509 RepID=A0A1S5YDE5_9VIRU|nr:hypothetical protein LbFV_ORF97 [Leptopilina boulardi filamentous virus]AQQ80017.1 hypothetical protein LbFV_ORF97 [Leptopilina boulardi filamentous virus]